MNVADGTSLGETVVRNRNGVAYLKVINTCNNPVNIQIFNVKLEEFDETENCIHGNNNKIDHGNTAIEEIIDIFSSNNKSENYFKITKVTE